MISQLDEALAIVVSLGEPDAEQRRVRFIPAGTVVERAPVCSCEDTFCRQPRVTEGECVEVVRADGTTERGRITMNGIGLHWVREPG